MKMLRTLLVTSTLLSLSALSLPAQAGVVTCKDGTRSAGGRGACSSHGGVSTAAMKAEAKATKAEAKVESKVAKGAAKAEVKADAGAAKAAKVDAKVNAKVARAALKADARADARAAKAAKADAKEDEHEARGATAECRDHTYSHAKTRRGACSRHGGVAKYLSGA